MYSNHNIYGSLGKRQQQAVRSTRQTKESRSRADVKVLIIRIDRRE